MTQNIVYHILIHIKLADKSRLKIAGFQFDYHIATKLQMIKQQIQIIEIISAYFQMHLSAHKRKALSQLQKKILYMLCQPTFDLNFSSWYIGTQKIKEIRILENLICHIGIRRW